MYETYTRYILTAWFSGRRNASLSPHLSFDHYLSPVFFMLHAACPLQPSSRQGDARKLASSSSTKFCTGSLPLTLHQEETVIFFFQRKFLLSKLYFNSSFYDSLRMKHHMCSISLVRENERNRDLKKLFRFVTRVILIINHHFHSYSTYILI